MKNANETNSMMQKEKKENESKNPNAATSGKRAEGFFYFFSSPKSLLKAIHPIAGNEPMLGVRARNEPDAKHLL